MTGQRADDPPGDGHGAREEWVWLCPNCGQLHFADTPPDMCDYCQDFTTWQRINRLDDYSE